MRSDIARWITSGSILLAGGAATWALVTISYDAFLLTGHSGPSHITGPNLTQSTTAVALGAAIAGAAWVQGIRRIPLLLLWLAFAIVSTHRLVEFPNGEVRDLWLLQPVQKLPALSNGVEGRRCDVGGWVAHCTDGGTGALTTATLIPFTTLSNGPGDTLHPSR